MIFNVAGGRPVALSCIAIFDPIRAPKEYADAGIDVAPGELLWQSHQMFEVNDPENPTKTICTRIIGRPIRTATGNVEVRACNCDGIVITCRPTRDFFGASKIAPRRTDTGNVVMQGKTRDATFVVCDNLIVPEYVEWDPPPFADVLTSTPGGAWNGVYLRARLVESQAECGTPFNSRVTRGVFDQCAPGMGNQIEVRYHVERTPGEFVDTVRIIYNPSTNLARTGFQSNLYRASGIPGACTFDLNDRNIPSFAATWPGQQAPGDMIDLRFDELPLVHTIGVGMLSEETVGIVRAVKPQPTVFTDFNLYLRMGDCNCATDGVWWMYWVL